MVFVVGPDPNWQQEKMARLMQALELAQARRERRKQEQQAQAGNQLKLILSAADSNPDALNSPTVREFVRKNAAILPGLEEWHTLESAARSDPNQPRNAYEKLLRTADAFASSAEQAAKAPFPMGAAGHVMRSAVQASPAVAFEAASRALTPSERVRAKQYAAQTGAEIPLPPDPGEPNKKLSGPMYVLHNPDKFNGEEIRAARIALQLEDPKVNPAEKLTGALFIVENPAQFQPETVRAAQIQLDLAQPPWEVKSPKDKLTGAFAVLNDPKSYAPEAVRYAQAIVRQTEQSGKPGGGGGSSRGKGKEEKDKEATEKGALSEHQAAGQIDDYTSDFYERFGAAGARRITPSQQRKAAQMLRKGEDVDSFLLTAMFPPNTRSLERVIDFHLKQPAMRTMLEKRRENPRARASRLRTDAIKEMNRLISTGLAPQAARARVLLELLEGAP